MSNARFLNESKGMMKEWQKTGLLEGIKDDHTRAVTAVLLENQKLAQRQGMLNETSTLTTDVDPFKRISIPLVRRVFPQLIANKIVSVQPLLGPTGLVYYLRFRYSSNKGAVRGASVSSFPTDDNLTLGQTAAGDTNLQVYYSSQFVENETTATDAGGDTAAAYGNLEHTPVLAGTLIGTIYDGSTAVQTFSVNSSGTFTFTDIGSPTNKATAGAVVLASGALSLTWNNDPGASNVVASYEYNMECNQDQPEINLTIEHEEITSKTRKLKAVWSPEVQQDIRSQHNLDADTEITAMLATEINLEIDREIIGDLLNNAGTVASWDYSTALGDTIKERYESLYVKITEISNTIHRKNLRAGANFIVCSPEVASVFETATAGWAPAPSETFTSSLGVQYVGTVQNRWKMYKDPTMRRNQLLLGYKGESYMDSGYFYCPYVPLTQTPVVLDPDSFCARRGLLTRYGKKMLREGAKFYARVNLANFVI